MQLPSPSRPLRIGTRGSPLALAQANETAMRLARAFDLPREAFSLVVIRTTGDRITDRPLNALGGKGLFTREIEQALQAGRIDIAVHSMKDMPTEQPPGLVLDCVLPREDVRDALVSPHHASLDALPPDAVVGTSSLRRRAQLLHRRPGQPVVEFRGNVQTRMRKLEEGVAAATFLAMAGLRRLGLSDRVPAHPLAPEAMLPAVGQGAIGIERRADDSTTAALTEAVADHDTAVCLAAERAFLAALDGSCQTPIAALAELSGGEVRLRGEILRPDGSEVLTAEARAPRADAAPLGRSMGRRLRAEAGEGFFTAAA